MEVTLPFQDLSREIVYYHYKQVTDLSKLTGTGNKLYFLIGNLQDSRRPHGIGSIVVTVFGKCSLPQSLAII